jgi:hypothetical protein
MNDNKSGYVSCINQLVPDYALLGQLPTPFLLATTYNTGPNLEDSNYQTETINSLRAIQHITKQHCR